MTAYKHANTHTIVEFSCGYHRCCAAWFLTSGTRPVEKEETPKVRPWNWSGSTLTMETASEGTVTLADSPEKTILFPTLSIRFRMLLEKGEAKERTQVSRRITEGQN